MLLDLEMLSVSLHNIRDGVEDSVSILLVFLFAFALEDAVRMVLLPALIPTSGIKADCCAIIASDSTMWNAVAQDVPHRGPPGSGSVLQVSLKNDMYLLQKHQFQGSIEFLRLLAEFPSPLDVGRKKDPSSDDDSDTLGLQYSCCCNCFLQSNRSAMYDTLDDLLTIREKERTGRTAR